MLHTLLSCAPLMAALVAAAVIDVQHRRIPNWITLPLLAGGLLQAALGVGSISIGQAAGGLAVGFGLSFVLLVLGGLGGGDVKLVAGVGAWLGIGPTLIVLALAAVVAMVLVLVHALRVGRTWDLLTNTAVLASDLTQRGRLSAVRDAATQGREFRSVGKPLPFAVPVSIATGLALVIVPAMKAMGL